MQSMAPPGSDGSPGPDAGGAGHRLRPSRPGETLKKYGQIFRIPDAARLSRACGANRMALIDPAWNDVGRVVAFDGEVGRLAALSSRYLVAIRYLLVLR